VRALGARDVAACRALSDEAGWNQDDKDWLALLHDGWGTGAYAGERLVASAVALPFIARPEPRGPRFGWISMVLVTQAARRQGLATRLTRRCIEQLRAVGCVAVLDATPLGQAVYHPMGFRDGAIMDRWRADAPGALEAECAAEIVPVGFAHLDAVVEYDARVFGAYRDLILLARMNARPDLAFVALAGGAVVGAVLGRNGRVATQLGPLMADDETIAQALLAHALAGVAGPAIIDLFHGHDRLASSLTRAGFAPTRPFTRMHLGDHAPAHDLARYCAAMGPEFG
jgi:GNAT superfamily N-acetyltransferase